MLTKSSTLYNVQPKYSEQMLIYAGERRREQMLICGGEREREDVNRC